MTISGGARSKDRVADDGLPDPLGPGRSVPEHPPADALPKGDVRVASWIAVASAIGVLLWYFSILVLGGVYLNDFNTPAQVAVWALAAVSLTCVIVSLNARPARQLAAAGFIEGVLSLLVHLPHWLSPDFQPLP